MRIDAHFEPILTDRLRLRRSRPEDADTISAYRTDPAVHDYQGWERTDPDGVRAEIEEMAPRPPGAPGGWTQLSVEDRETGELVGDVGMRPAEDEPGMIKIGYTMSPAFQGRGYATEAVRALIAYAFDTLGCPRRPCIRERVEPPLNSHCGREGGDAAHRARRTPLGRPDVLGRAIRDRSPLVQRHTVATRYRRRRPHTGVMSRRYLGACIAAFVASLLLTSCGEEDREPPSGSRSIAIATTGGAQLPAIEVGSGGRVVVLSHGATGTKEDFFGLAGVFAEDGWRAIAYDARSAARGQPPGGRRVCTRFRCDIAGARGRLARSVAVHLDGDRARGAGCGQPVRAGVVLRRAQGGGGDRRLIPVLVAVAEGNEPYATDAVDIADALGTSATVVSGDGHG